MDFFHGLVQVPLPAFPLEKAFLLENLVLCESRYGDSQKKAMDHRSVQEAVGQQWPEHLNRQEWGCRNIFADLSAESELSKFL